MSHSNESVCLTQKEPVRYTNKLIKKTTDTNYTEYLQLTKKSNTAIDQEDRQTDGRTLDRFYDVYHIPRRPRDRQT